MRNFNESHIVGGSMSHPGSKFDSFDLLFERYMALLFFTIMKSGISYSTERNGVLAKVRFEERGFVNYVQPCMGKWDYDDPKYQRLVSPDFVLFLFNNTCMAESLYRINELVEPIWLDDRNRIFPEGIDLDEFSVKSIIEDHEEYMEEYFKFQNGIPNYYEQIPKGKIKLIELLYSLLEKVAKYSKDYAEHHSECMLVKQIKENLEKGILSYDDLTENQRDLLSNETYNGTYESCPHFYLSLGYFNENIKEHVLTELYKMYQQKKQQKNHLQCSETSYDDPIIAYEDYYGEYMCGFNVKIDYENAKEFDYENNPKIKMK